MERSAPCLNCSALTDRPLCFACVGVLRDKLITAAWLARELETTFTRQSHTGAPYRDGGKASDTPLAFDDVASEAAFVLRRTLDRILETWTIVEPGVYIVSTPVLALWLAYRAVDLARRDDIGECFRDVCAAVDLAVHAVDLPEHSVYLTDCECGRTLYGDPNGTVVACWRCGHSYDVVQLRADARERGRNLYVTAAEAARYLGDVYGIVVTRKRITMWHRRGKLTRFGEYYRMGDIIAASTRKNVAQNGTVAAPSVDSR